MQRELKELKELVKSEESDLQLVKQIANLSIQHTSIIGYRFSSNEIINLYLYKKIKEIKSYDILKKYLSNNQEEALTLGFYKNEHDKLVLPDKRTFNKYLKKLNIRNRLDQIINNLKEKQTTLPHFTKPKKDYRVIKGKLAKNMKLRVYKHFNINIRNNTHLKPKEVYDGLAYISKNNGFANSQIDMFYDDYNTNLRNGRMMLYHTKKLTPKLNKDKILDNMNKDFLNHPEIKKQLRNCYIAIDIHNNKCYSKKIPNSRDTHIDGKRTLVEQYMVASITNKGFSFILYAERINSLDDYYDVLKKILFKLKSNKIINVKIILMDRGFESVENFKLIKSLGYKFLTPKRITESIKDMMRKSEGIKSQVFDYTLKSGKNKVDVKITIVPDKYGDKKAFCSNFEINPIVSHYLFKIYSRRWVIENHFKSLVTIRPKTTSRDYYLRTFYFYFSIFLYNCWVLANLIFSLVFYNEISKRPKIRLINFVHKFYGDVG